MAKPADNRVPLTHDPLIDGLTQGSAWTFSGAHALTYSFSLDDEPTTRVQWTVAWKSAFTAALGEWSKVANLSFTEAGSGTNFNVSTADIAVTLTSDDLGVDAAGLGIFPSPHFAHLLTADSGGFSYPRPEGDIVYVSTSPLFDSLEPGATGFEGILHEIGHALGLKHPFDDGLNGRPTFASLGITQFDSDAYTVMSYSGLQSGDSTGSAATPMPLDILAIQRIYGANMSYHTGDDVYDLHDDGVMRTIWDAGGDDTLDASSLIAAATIDLRPGHLSYPGTSSVHGASVLAVAYNMTLERAIGTNSDDVIYGNDAPNFIDGRGGADRMSGGPGNDTYVLDSFGDVVTELPGEGIDSVSTASSYSLPPNVEQLVLTGTGDIDGVGNAEDNQITGTSGSNHLVGLDGNDRLLGGNGNDLLDGGPGDDWLEGGPGVDFMRGGSGNDSYVVDASDAPLLLAPYSLRLSGDPREVISSGRVLYFTDATGTFSASTLFDLTGDGLVDYLTINYQEPGFAHTFNLSFATNHLGRNLAVGTYTDAERAAFAAAGHPGLDVSGDGVGSNTLFGSFAIQALQIDYSGPAPVLVQFSATFEQHSETPAAPALTGEIHYGVPGGTVEPIAELPDQGIDTVYAPISYVLAPDLESLTLTGGANVDGTGNAADNILIGNDGANSLTGLAGNDTLDGGAGDDVLNGGPGDDAYVIDSPGDQLIEAAGAGTDTVRTSITFSLSEALENLILLGANDIDGSGNDAANVLTGNAGANRLSGGGDDFIDGGPGNDVLDGGSGADHMNGGAGDDRFIVDSALDILSDSAGVDTVESKVSFALPVGFENLSLDGSDDLNGAGNAADNRIEGNNGANVLTGGAGNDTLLGAAGSDTLDGGAGADRMSGGAGNDTYYVDSSGDLLSEDFDAGIDSVFASVSLLLAPNVENLTLLGSVNLNAVGNALDNTLVGNAGNNLLDGGAGADSMSGGAGDDTYVVDNAGDAVIEPANGDIDSVRSSVSWLLSPFVENAVLTGTGGSLTGNEQANSLTGNDGGNVLDGGRGGDRMAGGKGDDTYQVDFELDQVNEVAGQGSDTIIAQVPQVLALNVENLTLGGSAGNIAGIGNAAANTIIGNNSANLLDGGAGHDTLKSLAGDDTLLGGDGNDSLSGGLGRDVLVGGAGADHFVFDSAIAGGANVDHIVDFVEAQHDSIDLSAAIFTALGVADTAAAAANTAQIGNFVKGPEAIALLTRIATPAGAAGATTLDAGQFTSGPGAVANDASEHIIHDTSTGMLYYDTDGNGIEHMVPFAHVEAGNALAASDFHLIA